MNCKQSGWIRLIEIDGFEIESELPHSKPSELIAGRWILTHLASADWLGSADSEGYRPMHRDLMRDLLGQPAYERAKARLLRLGHIEVFRSAAGRASYEVGVVSKRYRLSEDLRRCPKLFPSTHAPKLARKMQSACRAVRHPAHRWLLGCFDRVSVDPEWEGELRDLFEIDEQAKAGIRMSLHHLEDRTGWAKVDDFGLRFHTPFAAVKQSFRRHVRLDGERLVEIDLRNSQPLFLGLDILTYHAAGETWVDEQTGRRKLVDPYESEDRLDLIIGSVNPDGSPAGPCGTPNEISPVPPDASAYLQECLAGRWYETLALYLDLDPDADRDAVKIGFLKLLYRQAGREPRKIREAMEKYHPSVMDYVDKCKAERGYKFLSMRMQRTEAAFVFRRIVSGLMLTDPSRPLLTIHDALFCKTGDAEEVLGSIRNEFAQLGLASPALKVKPA